MTDAELGLLKDSVDKVVLVETAAGEHLAQILFVFDEGETPDVFYIEVVREADGSFKPKGGEGHSVLLSDVLSVRPVG